MHRTNLYFEEEALKVLNRLASSSGVCVADKVGEAVDTMLAVQISTIDWKAEINGIMARAHRLGQPDLSGPEIVETVRASRLKKSDPSK